MNTRERSVRAARRKISDAQLTAFLRAVRHTAGVLAVVLINDRLDTGDDLDAIFYDGDESGFSLSATRVSQAVFQITFGCQAGPLTGDGGEWDVAFDPQGRVASIDTGLCWVS